MVGLLGARSTRSCGDRVERRNEVDVTSRRRASVRGRVKRWMSWGRGRRLVYAELGELIGVSRSKRPREGTTWVSGETREGKLMTGASLTSCRCAGARIHCYSIAEEARRASH